MLLHTVAISVKYFDEVHRHRRVGIREKLGVIVATYFSFIEFGDLEESISTILRHCARVLKKKWIGGDSGTGNEEEGNSRRRDWKLSVKIPAKEKKRKKKPCGSCGTE